MAKVKLGDRVKCKITGFEGICYGISDWLNGCRRIAIKPEALNKDGNPMESHWFDEPEVEKVPKKPMKEVRQTGGPRQDPTNNRPGEKR